MSGTTFQVDWEIPMGNGRLTRGRRPGLRRPGTAGSDCLASGHGLNVSRSDEVMLADPGTRRLAIQFAFQFAGVPSIRHNVED